MVRCKRILLKLSGASMAGEDESLNFGFVKYLVEEIKQAKALGVELGIVVGGGNIIRGRNAKNYGLMTEDADKMGMIATFINGIFLKSVFQKYEVSSEMMNIFSMGIDGEQYSIEKAKKYLNEGKIVIFAGGTGKIGVTNDTASAMRAYELDCDLILKATDVDGVYSSDPHINKNAKKFDNLSFDQAIEDKLEVLDQEAFFICAKKKIPIGVFNIYKKGNLVKIIQGDKIGTMIQ